MMVLGVGSTFASVAGLTVVTWGVGTIVLLRRVSGSVGLAEPTDSMWEEEQPTERCALFRHLPELAPKLAWRSLGVQRKSPIHICKIVNNGQNENVQEFLVKREDLILDHDYSGNKVRSLQHQLAVCESRRDKGGEQSFRQLVTIGSGGSNQVVAAVVHGRKLGWDGTKGNHINVCWLDNDEPDLDNTLNMLSVLSFPNLGFTFDWGSSLSSNFLGRIRKALHVLYHAWSQTAYVPMMVGGNCPSGVLGQVGGVLELAEQIADGESPELTHIYVPMGSSCTIAGLVVGTVLVRHLRLNAFTSPDFCIVGCNVHDGMAFWDRWISLHTNPLFRFMPLTISHSVVSACRALKQLGGPDLESEAMDFMKTSVQLRSTHNVVGKYGAHSDLSRQAAKKYDEHGILTDYVTGRNEKPLWVCGHFVAKALQPLLQDLETADGTASQSSSSSNRKFMLWMTKSSVQPRGIVDEWPRLLERSDAVLKWANEGQAESVLRPGRVLTANGKPEDYRSLMTQVLKT